MIFPLQWDNGEVLECAFASERVQGVDQMVYLNIHKLVDGCYVIENKMFRRSGGALTPVDLPAGLGARIATKSKTPLFQIIKPNLVNNLDPDCPMGISVYANAIDQLEGLDLVYDSYVNEFRLGKKRILVPLSMAKIVQQEDGVTNPVFDENDTEFYAVDPGRDGEQKITEINMELRHQAHEAALKTALNLLSSKCGLGNDRYNFERGSVKTATEVVSEKSDLFQNLKKHELVLKHAMCGMCRAIASLLDLPADFDVTVNFDDSIIEDRQAERLTDQQQVRDRLMAVWEYRKKYFGESEAEAKSMAAQLAGEAQAEADLFGFGRENGAS